MRTGLISILLTTLLLCGCDASKSRESGQVQSQTANDQQKAAPSSVAEHREGAAVASRGSLPRVISATAGGGGGGYAAVVSDADEATLSTISIVQASTQAADRKIIRNAELTLEIDSPAEGLRRVTAIAEAYGGFVVTSDLKHNDPGPQSKPTQTVNVVLRVPAARFAAALDQVRDVGKRVISEKVSGQDVSEEYLDLEARLRTKKALEAQFLEIMKQARKVSDALEVQSQLADVRTEIERLEGRRRFLENQTEMSTLTVTFQMPQPIVVATTGGFSHSVKQAFGDAVDVAVSIVLTVIQAIIVLTPVVVLLGLPCWLVWRVVRRKIRLGGKQPSVVPES